MRDCLIVQRERERSLGKSFSHSIPSLHDDDDEGGASVCSDLVASSGNVVRFRAKLPSTGHPAELPRSAI